MEDDDVSIAGGIRCAEQRGAILESTDDKALLGQFIGQELVIDQVVLDEKDANGVRRADGGKQRGRGCFQGCDILFKSGGHLKSLPLLSLSGSSNLGEKGILLRDWPSPSVILTTSPQQGGLLRRPRAA